MRVLFASPHSLLDASSGAAISTHTLLQGLATAGHQTLALGATVYDTEAAARAAPQPPAESSQRHTLFPVQRGGVRHLLLPTRSWRRALMTAIEQEALERNYRKLLEQSPPDVVITYGGMLLERSVLAEARARGIRTVFRLVNPSYRDAHTFKDVDLIVTDTQATARLYHERLGLQLHPLGALIDVSAFLAPQHRPRYVTFVNPLLEKGASMVARLALMAKQALPDVEFLVVDSRGRWSESVKALGLAEPDLANVTVWPMQPDMRRVYGETRVLLLPSFWHESGGRVGLEAMCNGIPVIAESAGGPTELLGDGGILLDIADEVRKRPRELVTEETARPWFDALRALCTDPFAYASAATRAREASRAYDLRVGVERFVSLLTQAS